MRLINIPLEIEAENLLLNIPVEGNQPFVVVYSEGTAKLTYLPTHGEMKVIMHQGKVKRVRWEEGEDF